MLSDALNSSPFAVLTFIAAPAILTNASSVLTLSTGNRFARAIDRARLLAAAIAAQSAGGAVTAAAPGQPWLSEDVRLLTRQLDLAERRVLIIVRALTAFYFAMGCFALGTLTSLAGASLSVLGYTGSTHHVVLVVAVLAGVCGVGGLVSGATLLVWESRLTHRLLNEEAAAISRFTRERRQAWEAGSPPPAG